MGNMPSSAPEVLLLSKASGVASRYRTSLALLLGLGFLALCVYELYRGHPPREVLSKIFVGAALTYGSGYRKKISLTPEGIVKETRTFFSESRQVLAWEEVKHVTLAFKRDEMMGLFERGLMGWKVPFGREQEGALREILKERLPTVEVDTLGR